MSSVETKRVSQVLRYWRVIELFSPQSVPKVDPNDQAQPVVKCDSAKPLPWEPGSYLRHKKLSPSQTWRHTVYLGVYSLEAAFDVLQGVFAKDDEAYDERPPGVSAMAAFIVSDEGRILFGSEILSSCAWGVGRSQKPGPGDPRWLDDFEVSQERFSEALWNTVAEEGHPRVEVAPGSERGESGGHILNHHLLGQIRDRIGQRLQLRDVLDHAEVRIASQRVQRKAALDLPANDFLNSFIADDLGHVADEVARGQLGCALATYMSDVAAEAAVPRVDVKTDVGFVHRATAPDRIPPGRWPQGSEKPLALSQQLAINCIMERLSTEPGLFAVNGPPGTGKTTMLRDVVAAVVVQRADALARLKNPQDAFVGTVSWKTSEYPSRVHLLRPELTGFEMVVASSNNGAVQNVSDEIPSLSAIDAEWTGKSDYFAQIATSLLQGRSKPAPERNAAPSAPNDDSDARSADEGDGDAPPVAWGLTAGRLGNKRNRIDFRQGFWFDSEIEGPSDARPGTPPEPVIGMQSILKSLKTSPPSTSWTDAVSRYADVRRLVTSALAHRARVFETTQRLPEALREADSAQHRIAEQDRLLAETAGHVARLQARLDSSARDEDVVLRAQEVHLASRPSRIREVLGSGREAREWREKGSGIAAQIVAIQQEKHGIETEFLDVHNQRAEAQRRRHESLTILDAATREIDQSLSQQAGYRMDWPGFFTDDAWFDDPPSASRELRAPWLDPELCRLRSELFLAALDLHKAFVGHVPGQMEESLRAACNVLVGTVPRDLDGDKALAAWQSLFLVVPVLSTTFASFARVFSHVGREGLGWLLVDEAGQSTPQNAAGALWRSKRAVIVGDPLQLEPIVTIPFSAQQAVRRTLDVDEKWVPSNASTQRLADVVSEVGTLVAETDLWVGSPLRVHRRCDSPMFEMMRDMVYGDLVVKGESRNDPFCFPDSNEPLPASCWIDVVSKEADGNFIPAEFRVLVRHLEHLARKGVPMSSVIVVSPFRDVARRLSGLPERHGKRLRAGTVHTAQGKEADIVFFVLGGNPAREGAREWASAKPNLANVAVSRAKRRLYVIGNWSAWSPLPHFKEVARHLDPPSSGFVDEKLRDDSE